MPGGFLPAFFLAGLILSTDPAAAADWTGTGTFSQNLRTGGGIDFRSDTDNAIDSTTSLGLVLVGRTPRTAINVATGVNLFASTDSDDNASDTIRPNFRGSIVHQGLRTRLTGSLSFTPRFVPFTQTAGGVFQPPPDEGAETPITDDDDDTRRRNREGLQLDTNAQLGLTRSLDSLNSVSVGLFARRRDFTASGDGQNPSTTLGANAGWSHALTELTSLTLSVSVQQFLPDDDDDDDSRSYSVRTGFGTRLTSGLAGNASVGLSFTETAGDVEVGFVGDVGFSYPLGPTTSFSLVAAQSVDENADGELSNIASLSMGLTERLTQRAQLSISLTGGQENPLFGGGANNDRRTLSLAPSFSYQMTRLWRLNVSYALRYEDDDGDQNVSSRATLQISRSFDLF